MTIKFNAASKWLLLLPCAFLLSCTEKEFDFRGLSNPSLKEIKNLKKDGDRVDFQSGDETYSITALGGAPGLYTKKMNLLRMTIDASQREQPAPYPGSVTQVVQCNPAYATRGKTFTAAGLKLSGFYHFLTGRQAMENCSGSEVKFRGYWGYLQCFEGERAQVFEIKVTYPLKPAPQDSHLQGFRCS